MKFTTAQVKKYMRNKQAQPPSTVGKARSFNITNGSKRSPDDSRYVKPKAWVHLNAAVGVCKKKPITLAYIPGLDKGND